MDGTLTNDKCAAGSGKFLEMVSETLSVPFDSISDMALRSNSPYAINSQCAVFAESEIISQVNGGRSGEDILAGVLKSIVLRGDPCRKERRLGHGRACGDFKDPGVQGAVRADDKERRIYSAARPADHSGLWRGAARRGQGRGP